MKRGSSIPVKFRLGDATGATLPDASAAALTSGCLVRVTFDGTIQGCASYAPTTDTFQFDVKTTKSLAEGSHPVGIQVRTAGGATLNTDAITVQIRR